MSFDIFLQNFKGGDAADGDGDAPMAVITPLVSDRGEGWTRISTSDGEADIYGTDDPTTGLMFNHVGGRAAWDVIFEVASAAGFVVMPIGCGTLLPDEAVRGELPDGVPEPILRITSGAALLAIVESSS